jgi:hypothetical protein
MARDLTRIERNIAWLCQVVRDTLVSESPMAECFMAFMPPA